MKSYGSANIKITLLITGIILIIATLIYTQVLTSELLDRERDAAQLYAKSLQSIANGELQSGEYSFIFNNIIDPSTIQIPMIVTDRSGIVTTFKYLNFDTTNLSREERQSKFDKIIKEMDNINNPIIVSQGSLVLSLVHYGQSRLVTRLKYLPYMEILIAGIFIFLGYFGFNYIKRTEQSNIWVGLSRETAHQLGTPLSSLLGWNELIKVNANNPAKVLSLANEMGNDLDRLVKIANRFSKIGSKPDLKPEKLHDVIEKVINYYEKRIPRISGGSFEAKDGEKKIKLELKETGSIMVNINRELFEWVLENLTKNALDAIENTSGSITYNVQDKGNHIDIDVTDTGKGLDMHYRKDIFRPGYSTKVRGWGLGLSLSKRIIDNYHGGKLTVKESEIGKGTTFRIRLNKETT